MARTRGCLRRRWHFALCRRQLFFFEELVEDALSIGMLETVEHPGLPVIGAIAQLPLELEQHLHLVFIYEDSLFRYRRTCFLLLLLLLLLFLGRKG